jgi:hypothetical protein
VKKLGLVVFSRVFKASHEHYEFLATNWKAEHGTRLVRQKYVVDL